MFVPLASSPSSRPALTSHSLTPVRPSLASMPSALNASDVALPVSSVRISLPLVASQTARRAGIFAAVARHLG